jgi:transposase
MARITDKQLEKVICLKEIFQEFDKTNLTVREFCKVEGIHTSKFYYWKKRYEQQGKKGLIDKRQGISYKIEEKVKRYIQSVKVKDRLKSAADISELVKKRFNKTVSDRHIQRILKELRLNDPVGRKTGKTIKKTSDH